MVRLCPFHLVDLPIGLRRWSKQQKGSSSILLVKAQKSV